MRKLADCIPGRQLVLAGLVVVAITDYATAASFDCAEAETTAEKLICSDQQLSAADSNLSAFYHEALQTTGSLEELRKGQIAWLKNVRDACSTVPCMLTAYQERLSALQTTPGIGSIDPLMAPSAAAAPQSQAPVVQAQPSKPQKTVQQNPACVDFKASRHDFLPCNSCQLESKVKDVFADYYDRMGAYADGAGFRSASTHFEIRENDNNNVSMAVAEALRNQADPNDIKICNVMGSVAFAIQYKGLLKTNGIIADGNLNPMGKW